MAEITPTQDIQLRMSVRQVVDAAYSLGTQIVGERLHGTRVDYLKNYKMSPIGTDGYLIEVLEGAEQLEEGYGPFDMKPGLLHGPHAKIAEDGSTYNIVPIKASPEYGGGGTEFRVVTSKSSPSSWQHPGFAGVHLMDELMSYLESEIEDIIYNTLG